MAQQITLTPKQITLIKEAHEASTKATQDAQQFIAAANAKQKALNDLVAMFCDSHNIADPTKVSFDLDKGTATELDSSDIASAD